MFSNINIRDIICAAFENNAIIVDVRDRKDFACAHLPMAINIPIADIKNGNISLPKDKMVIVYCENGGSSTLAARLLDEEGYKVINAVGGIRNYRGSLTRK